MRRLALWTFTLTAWACAACGDSVSEVPPAPADDAGRSPTPGADDASAGSHDSGPRTPDAGLDATDSGPDATDSGPDATDSGPDAPEGSTPLAGPLAGKLDDTCALTSNPMFPNEDVLVDPTGTRVAYPRRAGAPNPPTDLAIRDLTTGRVTSAGPLGTCSNLRSLNEARWMRATPYGVLFVDDAGGLRHVAWDGAELARLPVSSVRWASIQVTVVGPGRGDLRAALVSRDAKGDARIVTYASDAGAGTSVQSAVLSPAFAKSADVSVAIGEDGTHAAALVAFQTLYAVETTAGGAAITRPFSSAGVRGALPRGALLTDVAWQGDPPSWYAVDFPTGATTRLDEVSRFIKGNTVVAMPGGVRLFTRLRDGVDSLAELAVFRFAPGRDPVSLGIATPKDANMFRYQSEAAAKVSPDGSQYAVAIGGINVLGGKGLLYTVALDTSAGLRPLRVIDSPTSFALGGDAILATREGGRARFEDLRGRTPPTSHPVPTIANGNEELAALSRDGHRAYFRRLEWNGSSPVWGADSVDDRGAVRSHRAAQAGGPSGPYFPAWTDGVVAVTQEGAGLQVVLFR